MYFSIAGLLCVNVVMDIRFRVSFVLFAVNIALVFQNVDIIDICFNNI